MSTLAVVLATATSPLWAAVGVPTAAVLGAIVTMVIARINEATNRRRDRYAAAVQTLVAWTEFPYRVRRRTDDSPATLTALANRGHDLQERLALHQAWIATEHPDLAHTYAETRATLNGLVGPLISDAWDNSPVTRASDMKLRGWGPGDGCGDAIVNLQHEIQNRFGVRRFKTRMIRKRSGQTRPGQPSQMNATQPCTATGVVDRDAVCASSSTEEGPPLWLQLSILAGLMLGSLGIALVGGLSGFPDLGKAILALYALGSLWGLGMGFWSFGRALLRLFKKAEPNLERFVDWLASTLWKKLGQSRLA